MTLKRYDDAGDGGGGGGRWWLVVVSMVVVEDDEDNDNTTVKVACRSRGTDVALHVCPCTRVCVCADVQTGSAGWGGCADAGLALAAPPDSPRQPGPLSWPRLRAACDVRRWLLTWRLRSQEPVLFNGSIAENIRCPFRCVWPGFGERDAKQTSDGEVVGQVWERGRVGRGGGASCAQSKRPHLHLPVPERVSIADVGGRGRWREMMTVERGRAQRR
eukprot:2754078-Rhodomonas_salina.2